MHKTLFLIAVLLYAATAVTSAQNGSSVCYQASYSSHATVDENGNTGQFTDWAGNKTRINYFKSLSLFIVIPENQEKGAGYFILENGRSQTIDENGDTEITYRCADAQNNPANILFIINKTDKNNIQIFLINATECQAFFISEVKGEGESVQE